MELERAHDTVVSGVHRGGGHALVGQPPQQLRRARQRSDQPTHERVGPPDESLGLEVPVQREDGTATKNREQAALGMQIRVGGAGCREELYPALVFAIVQNVGTQGPDCEVGWGSQGPGLDGLRRGKVRGHPGPSAPVEQRGREEMVLRQGSHRPEPRLELSGERPLRWCAVRPGSDGRDDEPCVVERLPETLDQPALQRQVARMLGFDRGPVPRRVKPIKFTRAMPLGQKQPAAVRMAAEDPSGGIRLPEVVPWAEAVQQFPCVLALVLRYGRHEAGSFTPWRRSVKDERGGPVVSSA